MKKNLNLSDGEWRLMNLLWVDAPRTIAQLVEALKDDTAWTKHTIFVMLSRLEKKGAVYFEEGGRAREYYPAVARGDAAAAETESFLKKVYGGSLRMMVNSMAAQKTLNREEIDELYEILEKAGREMRK